MIINGPLLILSFPKNNNFTLFIPYIIVTEKYGNIITLRYLLRVNQRLKEKKYQGIYYGVYNSIYFEVYHILYLVGAKGKQIAIKKKIISGGNKKYIYSYKVRWGVNFFFGDSGRRNDISGRHDTWYQLPGTGWYKSKCTGAQQPTSSATDTSDFNI